MRRLGIGRLGPFVVVVAVVCGFSAISSSADESRLVGRWQTVRTCHGLVTALQKYGLTRLAPSVVNDYFPDRTPSQLASKEHVCAGAKPQLHSHFFTSDGKFGSIDQDGKQVDDGGYTVRASSTVKINNGLFRFRVRTTGLSLAPMPTTALKTKALAHPLSFSTAGWMVAVAYVGHTWRGVPCGRWC
jgi:hypothetical protein